MLGSKHSRDWFSKCYFWLVVHASIFFFIFTIFVFIFWLIFLPQELKLAISDASLTEFNLIPNTNTNTTLYYNIALDISIRNCNSNVGVYHSQMEASANYEEKNFALANIVSTPFYQGHMNTSIVRTVLKGHQVVALEEGELSRFKKETLAGVYNIDIKLALHTRAIYGKITTGYLKSPKVDCQLKIPLSTSSTAREVGVKFNVTECGNVTLPLLWP